MNPPHPDVAEVVRERGRHGLCEGKILIEQQGPLIGLFALPLLLVAIAISLSRAELRKSDVPLVRGMTVEQVGRARPGTYRRRVEFEELPSARRAVADGRSGFAGDLIVRTPDGVVAAFPFVAGHRSSFPAPPKISRTLLNGISKGTPLRDAVRRLDPEVDARLRSFERATMEYELPRDASQLTRFSGELTSTEVEESPWILSPIDLHGWTVTFDKGRVVGIAESKTQVE